MTSSRWIAGLLIICGLAVSCGSVTRDGSGAAPEATAGPEPTATQEPAAAPEPTATPEATAIPEPTTPPEVPLVEPTPPPLAITCAEEGNGASYDFDYADPGDMTKELADAAADFANQVQADRDDVDQISSDSGRAVYHYSVDGVLLAIGSLENLRPEDAPSGPYWVLRSMRICPSDP